MTTITTNTASTALKQLFDRQAAQAVSLSDDEAGITALFPLIEKIGKVTEGEGSIPFVIVVQKPELTLSGRKLPCRQSGDQPRRHSPRTLLGGGCRGWTHHAEHQAEHRAGPVQTGQTLRWYGQRGHQYGDLRAGNPPAPLR